MSYRVALALMGLSLAMSPVSAAKGVHASMLLVVEKGSESLAIVDPRAGQQVASVPVEGRRTGGLPMCRSMATPAWVGRGPMAAS
jgi:hypothetical protein